MTHKSAQRPPLAASGVHAPAPNRAAGAAKAGAFAFASGDEDGYRAWRAQKLADYPKALSDCVVPVENLAQPSPGEIARITALIRRCNFAIYQSPQSASQPPGAALSRHLLDFAAVFGLDRRERHRSQDDDGVVALRVSSNPAQTGYIPYTDKPLKWHTDGYYNASNTTIRALILHCAAPAPEGGENAVLDPEIAYIRLRDEDPRHITALMHPEAMTIPENVEPDGSIRPQSIGPVFSVDPAGPALHMRFSARTRYISWRDDSDTRAARASLMQILDGDEPLVHRLKMAPGQGLLCNNVLHNRTGFSDNDTANQHRVLNRIRFLDRISCPDPHHEQPPQE